MRGCLGVLFHKLCDKSCIELNEAERGRLISPKAWDRIVKKIREMFRQSVYGYGLFGPIL